MKITVELSSPEELLRFFETMDPGHAAPAAPISAPVAPVSEPVAPVSEPVAPVSAPASPDPAPIEPPKTAAPEPKVPTIEEVTQAAVKKVDAGKQAELRQLLQKYGANSLPELKNYPDKLAAFIKDLEVL